MNRQNYDYVASHREARVKYRVRIRPSAQTVDEWRRETEALLSRAFEAFDHIVTVVAGTLLYRTFDPEIVSNTGSIADRYDDGDTQSIDLRSDDGLSATDVLDALAETSTRDMVAIPIRFYATDCRTTVYLNQGMVTVDGVSPEHKQVEATKVLDRAPPTGPTAFEFVQTELFDTDPIEQYHDDPREACDTVYSVVIDSSTTIWTAVAPEDTGVDTICRINRARLHEALVTLQDGLDVLAVDCDTLDGFPGREDDLAGVVTYDGPPAEELIEEYRVDWVASTLLPAATGEVVDGERIVDFGTVTESIRREELQARIDAYLRHAEERVDRVRVTTNDGETLTGDASGDGVAWTDSS